MRSEAPWNMMIGFFATGQILNECTGPCTCATGACN